MPADRERSSSPLPRYGNFDRSVDSLDYLCRKRLEDERPRRIEKVMRSIPNQLSITRRTSGVLLRSTGRPGF
ncbi:uncharacterized protein K452DRAFT_289589 [Aplosporella prunicola CBS 121167]|uniref:Splicing factor 1 helix-hairpin domain-containing protein n=1 Tax=Aplosporella prunicola CBS 121167 TaxID=1176127 RepID=A0A6A6BAQ5_9PEZI|nr:uncharacterized protein K452DRAFT_289589 [Aplosporella prunicola CBS 121167]KAF2139591.1 hypothetical protein K452DRAFT_289589 [Aplosporella prunicola CBS 121167]